MCRKAACQIHRFRFGREICSYLCFVLKCVSTYMEASISAIAIVLSSLRTKSIQYFDVLVFQSKKRIYLIRMIPMHFMTAQKRIRCCPQISRLSAFQCHCRQPPTYVVVELLAGRIQQNHVRPAQADLQEPQRN